MNHYNHATPHHWRGDVSLQPGIGVFIGQSGDNKEHRHWSHQISIALEGIIEMTANGQSYQSIALFVKAGTSHQLIASSVFSIYLDPTIVQAKTLISRLGEQTAICELPQDLVVLFRDSLMACNSLKAAIARFSTSLAPHTSAKVDPRLQKVLSLLMRDMSVSTFSSRKELAMLMELSETRFSHWFSEQTGMPLRSYRKWLRLVYALEQVLHGQTLTHAAYKGDFSDQAHFSRTCVQMFGVNPSIFLTHLTLA